GLQLFSTSTGGVGELANFLMVGSYVLAAGLFYKRNKTKKNAAIAWILASIVMGITAALTNYFILIPMFERVMPLDQVIASFAAFILVIRTKLDVVLFSRFPIALVNGLVIGAWAMLVYKRLTPVLKE